MIRGYQSLLREARAVGEASWSLDEVAGVEDGVEIEARQ